MVKEVSVALFESLVATKLPRPWTDFIGILLISSLMWTSPLGPEIKKQWDSALAHHQAEIRAMNAAADLAEQQRAAAAMAEQQQAARSPVTESPQPQADTVV